MNKAKSKKKIVLIILASFIMLLFCGWYAFCVKTYNENINIRCESYGPRMLHREDFSGLQCTEYSFPSDKGQMLAGYLYSAGENQHGIVVIAHGFGGGGQNSYMSCADFFAHNGYYVFAYDATAMDKSEGNGLGGVPQGVIDLEHAISFVEASSDIPSLPVVLFGHSWGGYCVCNVLSYHPEVRAVIECSGFNRSSDMLESFGKYKAGAVIHAIIPFIRIHERLTYGTYATGTAMKAFEASDAPVMIVHSADDNVIGIEYGYDTYFKKYKNNPRFTFIRFDDRGHNDIFTDPANSYKDEFNAAFDKWLETLDYDYRVKKNEDRFIKDKADYITKNLDHEQWSHRLDENLFARFLEFYEQALQ